MNSNDTIIVMINMYY